jgi:hypothetical protein
VGSIKITQYQVPAWRTVRGDSAWPAVRVEWNHAGETVELPDGSLVPREWRYIDNSGPSGAPFYVVECAVRDGVTPEIVTVMVCATDGGREVRASDLRRLGPLEEILEESVDLVATRVSTVIDEPNAGAEQTARRLALRGVRKGTRGRFTDAMAREVAEVYVDNMASGAPTKAVRDHFGIKDSTASLYVKRARPIIDNLLGDSDGQR